MEFIISRGGRLFYAIYIAQINTPTQKSRLSATVCLLTPLPVKGRSSRLPSEAEAVVEAVVARATAESPGCVGSIMLVLLTAEVLV